MFRGCYWIRLISRCPAYRRRISSASRSLAGAPHENHGANPPTEQHSRFADFERALFKRLEQAGFKRSKRFYGSVVLTTVGVSVAAYIYLFPHKLRQQVVEEVSTVASQSLEDEKIVTKAGQLSKDVLSDILNDKNTKGVASDFVKDIMMSQPIKKAALDTILGVLNDPEVLELLRVRLSQIILNILQNDATRQIVLSQINTILEHESIRASLQVLLKDLTDTPEVKTMMANFFRDVLSSDTVKNQGKLLGQQVTSEVISDKEIQQQAGNALWSALKYSVVPTMFRGRGSNNDEDDTKDDLAVGASKTQSEDSSDTEEISEHHFEAKLDTKHNNGYDRFDRYVIHEE